jgi:transposase
VGLTRRRFTREFKIAAVRMVMSGQSLGRVARELELDESVLRRWRREFDRHPREAFPGLGQRLAESREAELERKIGQLTLENDFLKKVLQRLEEKQLLSQTVGGIRSTKRSKKR